MSEEIEMPNRRETLKALIVPSKETSPEIQIIEPDSFVPGLIAVIPTHDDRVNGGNRNETVKVLFQGIAAQMGSYNGPLSVVVADNGISQNLCHDLTEMAKSLNVPLYIADARPRPDHPEDRRQAYALNKALEFISESSAINGQLRARGILFEDDDTVPLPHTFEILDRNLWSIKDAVAVVPKSIRVDRIDSDVYSRHSEVYERRFSQISQNQSPVAFPISSLPNRVDWATMMALGGEIHIKGAMILLKRDTAEKIMKRTGGILFQSGAVEGVSADMILKLALDNEGKSYLIPEAEFLDQWRITPAERLRQAARWAREHVNIASDLVYIGRIKPGISIFEPAQSVDGSKEVWSEWTIPTSDMSSAIIINPRQLESLLPLAKQKCEEMELGILGKGYTPEIISKGLERLKSVLDFIKYSRSGNYPINPRTDLPTPEYSTHKYSQEEFTMRNIVQIFGNIMGNDDISTGKEFADSPFKFLYGVHQ